MCLRVCSLSLSLSLALALGFPRGGWQGGRNWRTAGGVLGADSTVAPLIIENIAEELDHENEYHFDKRTRVLRVAAPAMRLSLSLL